MTAEQTLNRMLGNTPGQWDKSTGSWTYDIEKAVAIELQNNVQQNVDFIDKINVDNLAGEELTRFVFQRSGVERVQPTPASGSVTVTTIGPANIVVGDLFAAENVFFEATANVSTNQASTLEVPVRATIPGINGNVPAGAINSFPTTIANVSTVTNTQAFDNGFPVEDDDALRQRYYLRLQQPGKSGNKYHYREWAQEVAGVGKVKVFPAWNGPLTVKVAILDFEERVASQFLIDSVYQKIEEERPFGATVTVVTATVLNVNVSATFSMEVGYTFEQVRPNLESRLRDYFKSISFTEGLNYISAAQIGREILFVEGIRDYSNLTLNGSSGNLAIGEEEIPELQSVVNV